MNSEAIEGVVQDIVGAYRTIAKAGLRGSKLRSAEFVKQVAKNLRVRFHGADEDGAKVGVLAKGLPSQVPGLNIDQEFLYDIHAFEYMLIDSMHRRRPICNITGSLVMIESEFAQDNIIELITGLNKLIVGRSDLKVLVMARHANRRKMSEWLEYCKGAALNALDPFVLVVLPHPEEWTPSTARANNDVDVFRLRTGRGGEDFGLIPMVLR